jgi:hypothetical protein
MMERVLGVGPATAPVAARTPVLPVAVSGLAAFLASVAWYSPPLFGDLLQSLDPTPPPPSWAMLIAPLREVAASYVIAQLIVRLRWFTWRSALVLGGGLWLAFHAVMMAGAALFSGMPWTVAAIHAGDWLMKLLLMSLALSAWLGRRARAG